MNKTLRTIWNCVTWTLAVCVVICALLLGGVRIIGFMPYAVLSGSMEPTYHVGSLIYVKPIDATKIEVGDPITYILNDDLVVSTHRVIEVDAENQQFRTKGDANEVADGAPVHFNNLVGKPMFTIPKLGFFSSWISSPPGTYIAISGGVVLLLLFFLPDLLDKAEASDKKKAAAVAKKKDTESE